jgi:hypothetical protein
MDELIDLKEESEWVGDDEEGSVLNKDISNCEHIIL